MSKDQEEVRNTFNEIQNAMIKIDFDTLNRLVKDDKNMFIWMVKLRQNKNFLKK